MNSINDLVSIIQIAVAPVFLLTGIAGFLNVMSGRLGRIVDRARVIERKENAVKNPELLIALQYELKTLWRRINLINWSIGLCTASGLMVCSVVVGLFIGDLWSIHLSEAIVVLFVMALLLLIFALILFLKEVQLATRILKKGREYLEQ